VLLALGLGSHTQMAHMVIADNRDDDGEGAKVNDKTNLPTPLNQSLAMTFTLNHANPNRAAKASTSVLGSSTTYGQ
jgi:hypothetical protein